MAHDAPHDLGLRAALRPEARRGIEPAVQRAFVLAALLAWCAFLIAGRWVWTGHRAFGFLAWNLFLAAIPAFASTMLGRAARRRSRGAARLGWFLVWLLFLPNAPYIVTDFVHLRPRAFVPLWFDIALFASCAGTGLLLGWASTAEVQRVVRARFSARAGWAVALGAQVLSGFGIYLGRFLRWNSWDVIASPGAFLPEVARRLLDPSSHPRTLAVTLVYGFALALGYLALHVVAQAEPADHGPKTR
jgi:uncharacterized membrane protein